MSFRDRVDCLDQSLFDRIQIGGTNPGDRRSLLSLHAALAARGDFRYLEIGSYLGGSMQAFIVDPRCRQIVAIDRRDRATPDARSEDPEYPSNTTAEMLSRLSRLPGADLEKLITIDASTAQLDPTSLRADLCFIDAEHTNVAALHDARFCRRAIRDRGVIVFHDRTLVEAGIRRFLRELPRHAAYPLAHDLLVVELNIPSLLADPRVRRQVNRRVWLTAARLRLTGQALFLTGMLRRLRTFVRRVGINRSRDDGR